mmetsp:Transcript_66575/g.160720  ORF Transcript_66575/g.160720 Transcript_66575/m.160720 type:complete len:346 (+) Transcript_66575:89-1126(+)
MSIRIEPAELRFPFALNTATLQKLRVVAVGASTTFKIKTTNPKRYSVRPNLGIAWMGAAAEVTVQLCAFKELPPDLAKCKDKFQVLSLVLSDGHSQQLETLGPEERRGMLNELWAAEEAQAAAVISKVRCSFSLPSTQPMPIPEESEGAFSPATPAAADMPKGMADAPDSASGGAEASSSVRAAATPDAGRADGADPSPEPSDPAGAVSTANEQLCAVKAALAESEAARRTLKRQMEKAMLEHEDEIEALKQELNEQQLKQPPPPPLPAAGKSKGAVASGARGFTTMQLMLVALLGLLLGVVGQLPFGAPQPVARLELGAGSTTAAATAAAAAAKPEFEPEPEPE